MGYYSYGTRNNTTLPKRSERRIAVLLRLAPGTHDLVVSYERTHCPLHGKGLFFILRFLSYRSFHFHLH